MAQNRRYVANLFRRPLGHGRRDYVAKEVGAHADAEPLMTASSHNQKELALAYNETNAALGEPDVRRRPLAGMCRSMETSRYDTAEVRLEFEFTDCGATARAYGQQQAIIVSLQPGNQ